MKPLPFFAPAFLSEHGVLDWGYSSQTEALSFPAFEKWTQAEPNQVLHYLVDSRKNLRRNLKTVYPATQSALVFLFSYAEVRKRLNEEKAYRVASYALAFEGDDYHYVLRKRLQNIGEALQVTTPGLDFKISLDIEPILERDLAFRAGLGWFGKNSMLIHREWGSYFFIGSLLLNQKLPIVEPVTDVDHCGQCVRCVDACPTQAINPDTRTLNLKDCLSTFTIEMTKSVDIPIGIEKSREELFGCDICQDVCPWNQKYLGKILPAALNEKMKKWIVFFKRPLSDIKVELMMLSNRSFEKLFLGTPFVRPRRTGFLKTIDAYLQRQLK